MTLSPTLRCPCRQRDCAPVCTYTAPPAGETPFDLGGQPYYRRYDRCGICEHWFSRHDLDLSGLYDQSYVDATYGGEAGMALRFAKVMALPHERSDNRQRVRRILDYLDGRRPAAVRALRLLDVGAGLGVFPAAMREAGWAVTAIEPDPRTARHLCDVAGVTGLAIDLAAVTTAEHGRFDLISFNKVLEHVEDPVEMLGLAAPLLNDGGVVYVEVPDVAAASEGPGREEFFLEHHHVFSPASLAGVVSRAGLRVQRVERWRDPSSKFTVAVWATAADAVGCGEARGSDGEY